MLGFTLLPPNGSNPVNRMVFMVQGFTYLDVTFTTRVHYGFIDRVKAAVLRHATAAKMDVVQRVDWVIDLDPEGGDADGWSVEGTPEMVAACPQSITGQMLKKLLGSRS